MQYFEGVACPEELFIPTEDPDSYRLFPAHRWVYNKLLVSESQNLTCGPHGIEPPEFPVFSKPIYNMRGMGTGGKILESPQDYHRDQSPGFMWMPLLEGEHLSSDLAVVDGEAMWWRHTVGKSLPEGMFDYWVILADARPEVERYCGDWLNRCLKGYSGMVNFETIGGVIIECHLRFADQWVDLYGGGWLESVVDLYQNRRWRFSDDDRRDGFSVVLFGPHGLRYKPVEQRVVDDLLTQAEISSVQQTFHPDRPPEAHAMPPGGFRLAIVNCWDLETGFAARERLALHFWTTQRLRRRRRSPEAGRRG